MTAFEPSVSVYYDSPINGTAGVLDGIVDYSINLDVGSNDYFNEPNPGTCTVTTYFDSDVVPSIGIGDYIQIFENQTATQIFKGRVINRTSSYASWGTAGFLLSWTYELVGGISDLQKSNWYNPTSFTGTTNQCFSRIMSYAGYQIWSQVNPATTWAQVEPTTTWANYDGINPINNWVSQQGSNSQVQTLTAGWRNVWTDLFTLFNGTWGYIVENAGSTVYCISTQSGTGNIALNQMMTTVTGRDNVTGIRNDVTVVQQNGTTNEYIEPVSRRQYGCQPGTINTYLDSTAEAQTTGAKILNGLAFPYFGISEVEINLYNPNVTSANAGAFLSYYGLADALIVEAPLPMGGTQKYLPVGMNLDISKNAWIVKYNLIPYTVAVNSINWKQVDPSYTWSSYGVAFPTQKWSDL